MRLTPTELERLTIYTAAELARKHRAKGLKLNYPEAIALICDEILEGAREGRRVADLIGYGSTILTTDDVMPGVAEMMHMIQVEGVFPDGTKLVTVHEPIRPGDAPVEAGPAPGAIRAAAGAARPSACGGWCWSRRRSAVFARSGRLETLWRAPFGRGAVRAASASTMATTSGLRRAIAARTMSGCSRSATGDSRIRSRSGRTTARCWPGGLSTAWRTPIVLRPRP